MPVRDRFADHNYDYQLGIDDREAVVKCIVDNDKDFSLLDAIAQKEMIDRVTDLYQSFFARYS